MKQAVNDVAAMKAVHVGLEYDDDQEVGCSDEGDCAATVEKPEIAADPETLPTTPGTN